MSRRLPPKTARLTRRTLLRAASAGAVMVAAGGLGVAVQGHAHRYAPVDPACPLRSFTRREFEIVAQLSDVLFPSSSAIGISARQARVPEYVDHMIAGMEADKAGELKAMFLLFEHGTLAFGLRRKRFTDLARPTQIKYLRQWERARVYSRRMLVTGLKTCLGLAYFAHPDVRDALGIRRACGSAADALPREEWS